MKVEFQEFPKMARLSRECIISEKLDGTNAAVRIVLVGSAGFEDPNIVFRKDGWCVYAQSRTRFITPAADNFGFAAWVAEHGEELIQLGEGIHFGEWWGKGIQRGYDLQERRFSLFNSSRWSESRPACCHVVPVLYRGIFSTVAVDEAIGELRAKGSLAAPGYMNPEGIVVFHTAGNVGFKKTLVKDEEPKGKRS